MGVLLGGLGYPYALGSALTYTPHVVKPVVKEIEVPVKTITYGIKETGCKNVFGFSVPCLAEGEARRKRAADEAVEEKAAAAPVLSYAGLPLAYGSVLVPMAMVFLTPTLLLLSQLLSLRLPRLRFLNMSTRLSTRRLSWLLSATMVLDLLSPVPKQIVGGVG